MKNVTVVLFIYLAGIAAFPPAHGETGTLHYESEPGDYIGQGETRTYTEADGKFITFRTFDNGVNVNFADAWWSLSFAAPFEAELTAGFYPNAQRHPFQDDDRPGLDFSGDGRGCNTLTGEFTVSEIIWDWFKIPRRFSATLEQHCEGFEPALYGSIDYDFGGIGPTSLTAGNLLVVSNNLLHEFQPDGSLVQQIPILGGETVPDVMEQARDVIVSNDGEVHLFNGTYSPVLSSFDPRTGEWRHDTFSDWGIDFAPYNGGIGAYSHYVFVTDQLSPMGILRFDTDTYQGQRFADGSSYIDVTVGHDGHIYALHSDRHTIDIYDPSSLESLNTVTIANDVRSIAVNAQGEIFGVSWTGVNGLIYRFDAAGIQQAYIDGGVGNLDDINVAPTGEIVIGARSDYVVITTESLTSVDHFQLDHSSTYGTFVAFVQEPTVIFRSGFEE